MNRTATFGAGAALLLAGVIAFAVIRNSDSSGPPDDAAAGPAAANASSGAARDPETRSARTRERAERLQSEMVAQYGESRTNLSKHISSNVVSLLDDAVEMGEMVANSGLGGPMGARGGLRMGLGRSFGELNLTDEQQQKGTELYSEFQKRELERSKEAVERLRRDPASLMKLMLAGDAFSKGEISEDEYRRLQREAGEDLTGVINPLNERNFRGGRPLRDEDFVRGFEAVLDPEQTATLRQAVEQQQPAADTGEPDEANIAAMPSMELEQLDTTVESVKKLTTGFKSVMEGFGGLQDLGPMLEQQRRQGGGEGGTPAPDGQ